MLEHQDFFLEAEPATSSLVSLCGGRQFSRKFSKKDYPLLGDSDHGVHSMLGGREKATF